MSSEPDLSADGVRTVVCTLVFAWKVFPDAPIAVAANRDERYGRASEPPATLETNPTIVAPKDLAADGTWIGHNERRLFAGITNRWVGGLESERSRGLLVRDVLGVADTTAAIATVEQAVERDQYAGFNLLAADDTSAALLEWDGRLQVREFRPGVHVLANVGPSDDPILPPDRIGEGRSQAINARSVREALRPLAIETAEEWLARAGALLGNHQYGVCLHDETFGTVSTSLIRLGSDGASYRYAPGPPCETAFRPVTVGL